MSFKTKFVKLAKTDFGTALLITLGWATVMTVIGYVLDPSSLFGHTVRWDGNWYATIVQDWYRENLASAAFYPLFPLLVASLQFMSFGLLDSASSGQIINLVALWLALTAGIKIGRELLGKILRFRIVILLLSFPTAFFLHAFYGEAVFLALGLWAYYFALTRRWLTVGILLALLTATRLPSLLIIALCGLEFMRAYDWNIRKILNRNLLYFLLAPIGFILYGLFLLNAQGDFLGMFHAYQKTSDWAYQVFNPNFLETIAKAVYQVPRVILGMRPFDMSFISNIALPLGAVMLLAGSSIYLFLKRRSKFIPLAVTGALSLIMFTLNSNVVSIHRYILGCLVVFVALALITRKTWALVATASVGFALQIWLYTLFVSHVFVG